MADGSSATRISKRSIWSVLGVCIFSLGLAGLLWFTKIADRRVASGMGVVATVDDAKGSPLAMSHSAQGVGDGW